MINLELQVDEELGKLSFHDGCVHAFNFSIEKKEISIDFELYDNDDRDYRNHNFLFSEISHFNITKFSIFDMDDLEVFCLDTEKIDESIMKIDIQLISCHHNGEVGFPSTCYISFNFRQFKRIDHVVD